MLLAISANSYCQIPRLFEKVAKDKYPYWVYDVEMQKEGYDSFQLVGENGNLLTPHKYYFQARQFHDGMCYVFDGKKNKYGYVNSDGVETIKCKYPYYSRTLIGGSDFYQGLALVYSGKQWVYIDKSGHTILKLKKYYQWPYLNHVNYSLFSDGVAWVNSLSENGGYAWQVIRMNGEVIFQIDTSVNRLNNKITAVRPFCDGYGEVICDKEQNTKHIGLINKRGEICAVFNSNYELLENQNDTAVVNLLARHLYNISDEPLYENSGYFQPLSKAFELFKHSADLGNSYAQYVVGFMTQYGQGTEVNEQEAIKWYKKSNEPDAKKQLAMLERNASDADIVTVTDVILQKNEVDKKNMVKESVLQKDSIAQIPRLYVNEDDYYVKGGKAYDRQGKLVLSSDNYYIWSYSDGRFRVTSQNNLYGFVDIYGNNIIPCQYEDARDFRDGVARVCKKIASDRLRKWGYIDKNGKQVLPFSYGHVSGDFSHGLAYAYKTNQSSSYIINKKGEIVKKLKISNWNLTPPGDTFLPKVANYTYYSEGLIWLSVGNRLFLVNTNGDIKKEIDQEEIDKVFNEELWEVDEVYPFKRGLSLLRFEDDNNKIKIGYLYNKDGNIVAKYDFVSNKVFDEYKSDSTAIIQMAEYFYDNNYLNSALELFRQASSLGNSRSQYIVGFMTQYGQGIEANEKEAIKWYKKSNEPEAKIQLAVLEGKDVIHDPQQLFNEAFDFYYGKNGVEKDYKKAFSLFLEAAEKGDAKAQNMVGCMYDEGEGIDKNRSKALYWFKKSALQGNMIAQYNLGLRYELGKDVTPDATTAFSWYKNSASQGYSEALCKLGYFYQAGIGVDQNFGLAKQTHLKAVELGNANSMYYLGVMYEFGEGVDKDLSQALAWYNKAVENGFTMARSNAESLIYKGVKPSFLEINSSKTDAPAASLVINTPLKSNTVVSETSQSKIVSQNISQVQEQSKQLATAERKEKRIALVIGNADYVSHKLDTLKSPIKDARDIKNKLENLGFKVMTVVEDGREKVMRKAISDFVKKSKEYDVALFYYSGHGIQDKTGMYSRNFLIPVDAKLEYRENIESECIDLHNMIIANLNKNCKASIIFIDACRTVLHLPSKSDLGEVKGHSMEMRGLSAQNPPKGVCVVYATRADSVAYDSRIVGENSYFTQGLLDCLNKYANEHFRLFIGRLQERVDEITGGMQHPTPYNELYGDFFFDPNR